MREGAVAPSANVRNRQRRLSRIPARTLRLRRGISNASPEGGNEIQGRIDTCIDPLVGLQSRFVALPDVKCFKTKIVSGGGGSGLFQVWRILGKRQYLHVQLLEALDSRSFVPAAEAAGAVHIKSIDKGARAVGELTGPTHYDGADYYLYKTTSGEECAGFRRYGPLRRAVTFGS